MAQSSQPVVSGSAVASAGLASAVAALVTSRFGVAGTLLGAALTTMIITGGSAVLKSYLEGVTGRVRKVPGRMRARAGRMRSPRAEEPPNIPARPDLRNNFMGRLRAAFDWFLHLPPRRRQAILAGAIVPAVVAFLISMGAVTALEVAIGKSLPCGIWNNCPTAADGSTIRSTGPSITLARPRGVDATQNQQTLDFQQQEVQPGQNVQPGVDPNVQPADPAVPQEQVSPEPAPDAAQPQEEAVEPAPAPADQAAPQAAPPVEEAPAPVE